MKRLLAVEYVTWRSTSRSNASLAACTVIGRTLPLRAAGPIELEQMLSACRSTLALTATGRVKQVCSSMKLGP